MRQNAKFLRANLRFSIIDAVFFSLMVGMGEQYLAAFTLAMGHSEYVAGLITTLPLLAGGFLQLYISEILPWVGSYRRWVVWGSCVQALCFFSYAMGAYFQFMPVWLLFLITLIYWTAGLGAAPAWNAWLNSLFPTKLRTRFFSKRNYYYYLGLLIGMALAGELLYRGKINSHVLPIFGLVFLISSIARVLSAYYVGLQSDTQIARTSLITINWKNLKAEFFGTDYGRIMFFVLCYKCSVFFCAPYFTPFMLSWLNMSYHTYMLTIAASSLGSVVIMWYLRERKIKMDLTRTLFWVALGVALNPILWIFSHHPIYLFVIQIYSGMLWAVLELCAFLVMLNQIPEFKQARLLSFFNFFQTIAIIVGSLLGAGFLKLVGKDYHGYLVLLVVGTIVRFMSLFLCFPRSSIFHSDKARKFLFVGR